MNLANDMHKPLRLLMSVIRAFIADGSTQSAAALTYMTLFAVVPFLTVTYAVFSLIPAFDGLDNQLQALIITNLLPDAGREVLNHLADLSRQARSLTGFGIAFLGVTAFLMLKSIEHAFNAIWKVPQHRSGLNGFLVYWAVLSLGPLLIGAGLVISTYLLSLSLLQNQLGMQITPLLHAVPLVLSIIVFTLLFFAVPNCKVPWRQAFAGGVITAIAFELAKKLFTLLISYSSYQVVYGAFAAIPLFLLWIYCCWLLVLSGAHITHALSHASASAAPPWPVAILLLAVIGRFRAAQLNASALADNALTEQAWLFNRYSLSVAQWEKVRSLLLQQRWLARTDDGDYVLAIDTDHLPLWKILDVAPLAHDDLPLQSDGRDAALWIDNLNQLLTGIRTQTQSQLAIPVAQLWQPQAAKTAPHG